MAAFVMVYEGGSTPKTDDDIAHEMARWGDWMNSLGSQLIEPGACWQIKDSQRVGGLR